jgi:hypothetical protein
LWTPGYWGWGGSAFVFHAGYWGPTVGFYGGINYGFGYAGFGYVGGYWSHGALYYNRSVNNFGSTRITNVYNRNVEINRTTNVSYNGGRGGTTARPTAAELAATREHRLPPTQAQLRQERTAAADRGLRASENPGKPPIAATRRAGKFTGHGVAAGEAAPARHAIGAEHRPAATARKTAPPAAQHRNAFLQEHSAVPQRPVHHRATERAVHERAVRQQHAAQGRAMRQRAVRQRAAPERAAHQRAVQRQQAGHGPAIHQRAEHAPATQRTAAHRRAA